jgi:hypothetical protein
MLFCSFQPNAVTQDNNEKPPTKEEMKAEFEQSIRDAKQQRDELLAQIAEAKKNKEDAESISEMEKQLSTVNQMISMMEKANPFGKQVTKTAPPPKNTEPAYVSPFTPINLKQAVSKPTWAQATDRLLWYRGRRIDANTLITPSGLIARYNQQQHVLTLQPERTDTPYYSLVNTLGQIRQLRLDYSSRMDGMMNSYFLFPLIEDAYKEYEFFKERYFKLAENTIQIGTSQGAVPSLEQYINNLANYVQNLPPARAISPPKRANNLCLCDYAAARRRYENDLKDWKEKFFAEENKILNDLSNIFSVIEYFKRNNLSLPSNASLFTENFDQYHNKVLERSNTKLSELANQYPNDVLIEDGLVLIWSTVKKHRTAMDQYSATSFINASAAIEGTLFRVKTLVLSDIFENYIEDQKRLKNYNKVFDFGLYTAHEFNKGRLEPNYQVNKKLFDTWIKGVEKFNRFKLNIDIDFQYNQENREDGDNLMLAGTGDMKSEDIYVSLGRWECQWELYMTDQNHRSRNTGGEEFRIPMKIEGGTQLIESPRKFLQYSGPAYMKLVFPTFKINLCGNQSVAMLDVLSYGAADLKAHARDQFDKVYTVQMLQYVNKLLTGARKTQLNAPEFMSTALEMMNMNNQQMGQTGNGPAYDRLKFEHSMNRKKADLQFSTSNITHTANTVIPLVKTMQIPTILFNTEVTLDNSTDEDNKKYGQEAKGKISIKIVHAPR